MCIYRDNFCWSVKSIWSKRLSLYENDNNIGQMYAYEMNVWLSRNLRDSWECLCVIDVGRFKNIQEENKLCELCDVGIV